MSAFNVPPKILLLGGTGDANRIAEKLAADADISADVITSLAGATKNPKKIAGSVISGGFGGLPGLIDFLTNQQTDIVIDATHPYATQISLHAHQACAHLNIPLCRYERPQWAAQEEDEWHEVENNQAAAELSAKLGSRILLTTGSKDLKSFFNIPNVKIWARMVGLDSQQSLPSNVTPLFARGPFDLEGERALVCDHKIDVIITKNSGGEATVAKISAARELNIPVIMIKRPTLPKTNTVDTTNAMMNWLKSILT